MATKICKICGKEYPYCKTFRPVDVFRWQDVACCEEHGSEYFAKILESRSGIKPQGTVNVEKTLKETTTVGKISKDKIKYKK